MTEYKKDLNKSWNVLKEVINRKKQGILHSEFLISDKIVTDKTEITEGFNDFFTNVGPNLAQGIPAVNKTPRDFMKNRILESMFLNDVLQEEVEKIINSLKVSSAGWDSIGAKVIKVTHDSFIIPLTHVLNLSIINGVFPAELKIAKVIP